MSPTKFFTEKQSWSTIGNDTQYLVQETDEEFIIAFYGSNSKNDWKNNFNFFKKPYKNMEVPFHVHRGFLKAWKLINDHFLALVKDVDKPITVVGLSVTSGKTLTVNNTITLSGTDNATLNIGGGGTLKSGAFADAYNLPTASVSTLGGIKVGDGLVIDNGTLSTSMFRIKVIDEILISNRATFDVGAFLPTDTFDFFLNGIRVPETEFTKATPNLTLDSTALAGDSVIIIKNESSALEVGEAGASSENVANYLVKRDAYKMFKSNGIQIDSDTDPGFIIKFNKDDKSLEIEYVGV